MRGEVYSWRLSSDLKRDLEEAARRERVSVARFLERIAREWLKARAAAAADEAEQARLRAIAMRYVGTLRSGDPDLSEKVSERVRERLLRAHARSQSD
jgi:predicted DNA-binding ribbon-helix-helix protein